jgi:hypothetical protein
VSMFPLVHFDRIDLGEANGLLELWGHQMGPVRRRPNDTLATALYHEGRPVAVAVRASLIREAVGGGWAEPMGRGDAIELARLCAERRHLNRVVLRLWREFVFPTAGVRFAISYQDAVLHGGDLYRFDGWQRSPEKSYSGSDSRSGRHGRQKWVWRWPPA